MRIMLDKLEYEMQLAGMSVVSQENYRGQVRRFLEACDKPIDALNHDDVRQFLHHLRYERQLSIGSVNYYHTCIKFFYECVLEQPWNQRRIPRLRGYHTVPTILSRQEVRRILGACESIQQETILTTIYASGLRNGEACRLQVQDILSPTMQIFVRESKRNRQRYTILASDNLELLRRYWYEAGRPLHWLFPGEQTDHHLSVKTVRRYLERACAKAGIQKKITVHTLRHCFATHFLEDGHSLLSLSRLLGHSSLSSTSRYVALAQPDKMGLRSPLDGLDEEEHDDDC